MSLYRPPIDHSVFSLSVPLALSNVIGTASGVFSYVYLGQMLGVSAVAAATAVLPIMLVTMTWGTSLCVGATVLISQASGARDAQAMRGIVCTALTVALASGAVLATIGLVFARELLVFLATPVGILDASTEYARVTLWGLPLTFLFLVSAALLRGMRETRIPLNAMAIHAVLCLVLTPALIRGWGVFPALGVAGAAWATLCATVVALIWLAWVSSRKVLASGQRPVFQGVATFEEKTLQSLLRIGMPSGVLMLTMAVAQAVQLGFVNQSGAHATAAYGTVTQITGWVHIVTLAINTAVGIVWGQAIGAGQMDSLSAILRAGTVAIVVAGGGLVALLFVFSRPLLGVFLTDSAAVILAQELLAVVLWSAVFFGMAGVFTALLRAARVTVIPAVISIVTVLAIQLPLAWQLSEKAGLNGVGMAMSAGCVVTFCVQGLYFRSVLLRKAPGAFPTVS